MRRAVVLGAGVVGLESAIRLKEAGFDVTIVSEQFTPHTTGDGAAGIVLPHIVGDGGKGLIRKWFKDTFEHYHSLYCGPFRDAAGVSVSFGYELFTEKEDDPDWADIVFGFRHASPTELRAYGAQYTLGWFLGTMICECPTYLPFLMARLADAGVKFVQKKVTSLKELTSEYSRIHGPPVVVVNCTGIGANALLGDRSVVPVRGQVIKVRSPSTHLWVAYGSGTYIIPRRFDCVMGGTALEGNWSTTPDEQTAAEIKKRCVELDPSLKDAEVIKHWAGLRPSRPTIRIEAERVSPHAVVVHNYGHGGCGVSLAWGCAGTVVELALQSTATTPASRL